ncbi:hypothetical protein [Pseudoroseomonas cervicalis]|uniref:hypothetical protein n=1 Tax=Teichococcus cervicalis TaxID=204525 RepID=UPI00277E3504|nr:hypothetical protein [Pseudoroseomonas cervicalis]MDQ1078108.1 uncharacterized protein YjiS (DUF1127 family) [Pseudoroseomonas cervicalis]
MTAATRRLPATLRALLPALPARRAAAPPAERRGPAGEGALARALRWIADREHLAELEPRLLRDVGLTAEELRRGTPFPPPDTPRRL